MKKQKFILSPFAVVVVAVCSMLIGIALLPLLSTTLWPENNNYSISISYEFPGASERIVESKVTSVLENALSSISGVTSISSNSSSGQGSININFDEYINPDVTRLEVSAVLRQIASELPEGVTYPIISSNSQYSNDNEPFLVYSINSMNDASQIKPIAEKVLKTSFANLDGLSEVNVTGGDVYEMILSYDSNKLRAANLTPEIIGNVIRESFSSHYVNEYKLVFNDSISDDFIPENIFVKNEDSLYFQLKSLINCKIQKQDPSYTFRVNGRNSVYARFYATSQSDILSMKNIIEKRIYTLNKKISDDVEIIKTTDNCSYIENEIYGLLIQVILSFGILTLIIFLTTFSFRYLFTVLFCIFINLLSAIIFYYIFDIGINLMTIAAFSVVSGLIADNIIVSYNHLKIKKNLKVILPILAATLTTAGSLFIIFFVNKELKESLYDFCIVIIINLLLSVIVALLVVPAIVKMQSSNLKSKTNKFKMKRFLGRISLKYKSIVAFQLRFKFLFIIFFLGLFCFSFWLFKTDVQSGEYYNRKGEICLSIDASMPCGAVFEETDALIKKMEVFLSSFDRIRQFNTYIYNSRQARIQIYFTKKGRNSAFPYILKSKIIDKALQFGAGAWTVYGLPDQAFNNDVKEMSGNYCLQIQGFNYDELLVIADSIKQDLMKSPRIVSVDINPEQSFFKDDNFEYVLIPNLKKLAELNISTASFCNIFHDDITCGQTFIDNNIINMILRSSNNSDKDIYSMLNKIINIGDKKIRISQIVDFKQVKAQKSISRVDRQYQIFLQFDYLGSEKNANKRCDSIVTAYNFKIPAGYKVKHLQYDFQNKNFPTEVFLLLIIALIIFFITAILFNSLKYAFVILLLLPVAFTGSFFTFWLFDIKFDSGGFASFVLLSGLTVNSGIFVIYEFINEKTKNKNHYYSFFKALNIKIGAICLTILSTIAGFSPFIIASEHESFRYSLACSTSGGLFFSITGLLFLLPLFCLKKM
ncbi:MAG: efflux RND transporter permease subunit [Bacteroidales bacterium]|nr:efflux RND transporter permease subunit [Bacteroidales bacterium]